MSENTEDHTHDVDEATGPAIVFGYAVLVTEDGSVYIERNPDVLTVQVQREASLLEVRRYTSEILMDLQAQSAAEYVSLRLAAAQKNTVEDSIPPA
jgi:hypothetical protein